jgi:adenine-specific DNA methylase
MGDPVRAQKKIQEAIRIGTRVPDPFGYARAFTYNLEGSELRKLRAVYEKQSGSSSPLILDPMAGGGSIPFEALRAGARVIAGEYNPVAHVVLKSTLEYPAKFGPSLSEDIAKWGQWVNKQARRDLEEFYPHGDNEQVLAYIWARTIQCPSCNLRVPLSPNWWLSKRKGKKERVAVRLKIPNREDSDEVSFEIIDALKHPSIDPSKGTAAKGKASCPRCNNTIREDQMKTEAQEGRMGHQLFAIFIKIKIGPKEWEKNFRLPTQEDLKAYGNAVQSLERGAFRGVALIPREQRYKGPADRAVAYGVTHWDKAFNARQLLTHAVYLQYILDAKKKIFEESLQGGPDRAKAIVTYLTLILDKCLDYNAILVRWESTREIVKGRTHDYRFISSYGEMNETVPDLGFEWAVQQVVDSYEGLCRLLNGVDASRVQIFLGSSTELSYLREQVDAVIVDPPYYANVMYGELSDFFYVWMKRVLADLYHGFDAPLTDKDGEVVANQARFRGLGVSADQKAKEDYRLKMAQTFKQIHRVLKPNGILVVMFTHKATEAWDTLATALIDAGFQIKRSWPIQTESEHSLHIAKKNAVKSTIFLVARKTIGGRNRGWWEQEVFPEIEKTAEARAADFEARGVEGVDLYISTFGPVLEVFSRYQEVKSMTGEAIPPEEALDVARRVVTNRTFQKLVPGGAPGIDDTTKFYILAMYFYRARQFPFDEAHKLAMSVGTDSTVLRDREHIIMKKQEDVVVLEAAERERSGNIDLESPSDKPLIDAIHLTELAFQRGGLKAYRKLAERLNLETNPDFSISLKALYEALPEADPEKKALASLLTNTKDSRAKGSRMEDYLDR